MTYSGGKNGAGVYQAIINNIPPHRVYIETHFGSGAIMRLKRPAEQNIGIELDPDVYTLMKSKEYLLFNMDCVEWLTSRQWEGDEFVYLDPPYVMSSRRTGPIYRYEYDDQQHIKLLTLIKTLPCKVAISGYHSDLYEKLLEDWRYVTFKAVTRGGSVATEYLWMNYPEPLELHDYQYLGKDYKDRQRIKRKLRRWKNKFEQLPALERQVIFKALQDSHK